MDDEDRPRQRPSGLGAAGLLSGESLDSYSLDELDARVELLRAEIDRIAEHRGKSAAHMQAADALFRQKPS
ncbi:MAG: DUF1192 domain-containing protein [Novosphingobium sp.]|nr:DUF1192 domain-containing protein [Novosphingobium sp.]